MWKKFSIIKISVLVLLILNLTLLYQIILGPKGIFYFKKLRFQKQQLSLKLEDIQKKNMQLTKEVELIKKNREFQEYIIRKVLHMGKKNEVLYLVSNSLD